MKQKGISTEVLKDFRIKGKWKVIAVLKVTFPKFHMNSQQGHLFLNFISQRNWFLVCVCVGLCAAMCGQSLRGTTVSRWGSAGGLFSHLLPLWTIVIQAQQRARWDVFKDNFYTPSKMLLKRKERINLYSHCGGVHDAIDVLFCHTSWGFFWVFSTMSPTEEQVCLFRKYFYCQSLGNLWGNVERVFIYKINSGRPNIELVELHIRPSVVRT